MNNILDTATKQSRQNMKTFKNFTSAWESKWYQSSQAMPAINIEMAKMGFNVLSTYECLTHCASKIGACMISQKTLAKAIGATARTVRRDLRQLASHDLIAILTTDSNRKIYVLNPYLIWRKAKQEKLYYSKVFNFPVNVVNNINNKSIKGIMDKLNDAKKKSIRNINFGAVNHEQINNQIVSFKKRSDGKKVIKPDLRALHNEREQENYKKKQEIILIQKRRNKFNKLKKKIQKMDKQDKAKQNQLRQTIDIPKIKDTKLENKVTNHENEH